MRKGGEDAVVDARATPYMGHMVCDHIHHEIHAPGMKGRRESNEVGVGSESRVQRPDIIGPVAVVRGTVVCRVLVSYQLQAVSSFV